MRRAVLALLGTVTALVMLLSFKTHTATVATPPAAISTPTPGSASAATPASSAAGTSSPVSSTASTKTVTGAAADTRYGPVQVRITVTNGRITSADAVVYPNGSGRDQQINSSAVPQLNNEAISANSAKIDTISGATYTSVGYLTSLQSALDQAGL